MMKTKIKIADHEEKFVGRLRSAHLVAQHRNSSYLWMQSDDNSRRLKAKPRNAEGDLPPKSEDFLHQLKHRFQRAEASAPEAVPAQGVGGAQWDPKISRYYFTKTGLVTGTKVRMLAAMAGRVAVAMI